MLWLHVPIVWRQKNAHHQYLVAVVVGLVVLAVVVLPHQHQIIIHVVLVIIHPLLMQAVKFLVLAYVPVVIILAVEVVGLMPIIPIVIQHPVSHHHRQLQQHHRHHLQIPQQIQH